jgi:hypothetical protein
MEKIGLVEANLAGHTLTGGRFSRAKHTPGLPDGIPHYRKPPPSPIESINAWSRSSPTALSRTLQPRSSRLHRSRNCEAREARSPGARQPALPAGAHHERPWRVQVEAIRNLKARCGKPPRALIQMATGSANPPRFVSQADCSPAKRIRFRRSQQPRPAGVERVPAIRAL